MVVTKNQIRPRRKKFHFINSEILLFQTVGQIRLVPPAPAGQALAIEFVQFRTQIVAPYTNIDVAANIEVIDDFQAGADLENDATSGNNFTSMFAPGSPLALNSWPNPRMIVDSNGLPVPIGANAYANEADIATNGGIFFIFNNTAGNLTGGNPGNFFDIFIDYKIINLDI